MSDPVSFNNNSSQENAKDFQYIYDSLKALPPVNRALEYYCLSLIHGIPAVHPEMTALGLNIVTQPTPELQEQTRKNFIARNMRLVISIVRKKRAYNDPITMYLISAGEEGLIVAVDKFDVSKGTSFSTYATYWIEHYIKKEFDFLIREIYPTNTPLGKKFINTKKKLRTLLQRVPYDYEVFEFLCWTPQQIHEYNTGKDVVSNVNITFFNGSEVEEQADIGLINKTIGVDTLFWLYESNLPEEEEQNYETFCSLEKALSCLEPTERDILNHLFGLCNYEKINRKDLALILNISITTLKKIEQKALKKLFVLMYKFRKDF